MDEINKILSALSPKEQEAVLKILDDQAKTGNSPELQQLYNADYEEIPVDIDTFLESPEYLGNSTNNGKAIYPYWRNAYREIIAKDKIEIAMGGSIGCGKAAPLDSYLVGPNGYFRMGDVKVGDLVAGQDGKFYHVTSIWPQGKIPIYRITFSDHTHVDCSIDHLWNIRRTDRPSKKQPYPNPSYVYETKSVRWLLQQDLKIGRGRVDKNGHKLEQNKFAIQCTLPVQFKTTYNYIIPPYLLGLLIADGALSSGSAGISIYEQDIKERVSELLKPLNCHLKLSNPSETYPGLGDFDIVSDTTGYNPVTREIKKLKLNVKSVNKHIPKEYLISSVENRVELLRGLVDGDGYICPAVYMYSTSSKQLYEDFCFLVYSLGGTVMLTEGKEAYRYLSDGSKIKSNHLNYEFTFHMPKALRAFHSEKHTKRFGKGTQYHEMEYRFIESIEPVGESECQCITVDNPESLYLMDNFTVTHNTTAAIYLMIYFFYKLMCLRNIRQYYQLEGNGPICIAFLNNTIQLSKGVAYDKFMSTVANSPWFLDRGEVRGTVNIRYKPKKNIEFVIGSSADQIIGRDIFCAIQDECNFSKGADIQFEKNKVLETYNACFGRIKNRFTVNGRCQGRIFLVSSKKTEYDFLNQYIQKKMNSKEDAKNLFVADAKAFEVKPKGSYSGKMFRVAVGGSNLPSKIPEDEESTEDLVHQGYEVYDVPVELRGDFELDINRFIADHLGIAVSEVIKFMPYNKIASCYKEITNPFPQEVIYANLSDNDAIKNHFRPELVPESITSRPMFIHLDTSGGKGDRCGISDVACMGYVNRNRYSEKTGNEETTKQMLYRHVFSVGLDAIKSSEISFQKIVDFLWYLKFELGWNIKAVSTDGYMGQFLRQQISAAGFSEVNYVSLDRSPEGYLALQSIFAENRIALIQLKLLETELVRLERNNVTGKIDHPPIDGCFTGDTQVALVDGRNLSILEIQEELSKNKSLYVYTCNEATNEIEPQKIKRAFFTKRATVLKITLDNEKTIYCSNNHKFMLRSGQYVEADQLQLGMSLMPLYTKESKKGLCGYTLYFNPHDSKWHYAHRKFVNGHAGKNVVHHIDFNKNNNNPDNLAIMTRSEHSALHNRCQSSEERLKRSESMKLWHEKNRGTAAYEERREKCRASAYRQAQKSCKPKPPTKSSHIIEIEQTFNVNWESLSLSDKNRLGNKLARMKDPTILSRISNSLKLRHKEGLFAAAYQALSLHNESKRGCCRDAATKQKISDANKGNIISDEHRKKISNTAKSQERHWYTNGHKSVLLSKYEEIPEGYCRGRHSRIKNHKIIKIEKLNEYKDLYDLEIENTPNFALAAGVFVHNSKDIADSLAGAVFNATKHEDELNLGNDDLVDMVLESNTRNYKPATEDAPTTENINEIVQQVKKESKASTEAFLAEVKRRSNINYNDTIDANERPWNPSDGILD